MTTEKIKQFSETLEKEDQLLNQISETQKDLRFAVQNKCWDKLTSCINKMNELSTDFVSVDEARDVIQNEMTSLELHQFSKKINEIRFKLSQSKIESQALTDYINITRGFINGVLDKASTKTYSRYGQVVQKQPVSVILSAHC